MKCKCKMCGWKGTAEIQQKEDEDGIKILFVVCPECHADIYAKSLEEGETEGDITNRDEKNAKRK